MAINRYALVSVSSGNVTVLRRPMSLLGRIVTTPKRERTERHYKHVSDSSLWRLSILAQSFHKSVSFYPDGWTIGIF